MFPALDSHPAFKTFLSFLIYMSSHTVNLYFCIVMFLFSDTLIALKNTILFLSGLFIMEVLKMFFMSPRPFWVDGEIYVYKNQCYYDFAMPVTHIFTACFFWPFCLNTFYKYMQDRISIKVMYLICAIYVILVCLLVFAMFTFGLHYLY